MRFIEFKENIYSENGEDGIIRELLRYLQPELKDKKWCVEFGAWDGRYASNTFNLVEEGWHAVYIEGDENRYQDLLETASMYPKINTICTYVSHEKQSERSLDSILRRTPIPDDFDLLSIDIDSFDLEVWSAFEGRPKVVIIEVNSSIKPGVLQWHDGRNFIGNSFTATLMCARGKGYTLVCHTGNMIFVRDDLMEHLEIEELDLLYPERLFVSDWVVEPQQDSLLFRLGKRFVPKGAKEFIKKRYIMTGQWQSRRFKP